MRTLVLASASPRRAELLRLAGLEPLIHPTACDERWRPGEDPIALTRRLALDKAGLARAGAAEAVVLAADTTVWWSRHEPPTGKPGDRAEAAAMLGRLFAETPHRVTTAWAIWAPGEQAVVGHETTAVYVRDPGPEALAAYLATDDWRDKAGGYAIQGRAAGWIDRLEGSYTNVVGLPLSQVLHALAPWLKGPR